jgi:DNA-binding CsgD family transcriptional regulator
MVERLRATDVRATLEFVGDAYRASSSDGFQLETLSRLRSLVPCDMAAWVETRTDGPGVAVVACPRDPLPDGPRRFARVRKAHPVLAHFERTRHGGAAKLSDFLARRELHRLAIYREFFRPAGVEHQISIALPSDSPDLVRITLNRSGSDFSERDRLVFDLVRSHIGRAHRSAEATRSLGDRSDLGRIAAALVVGVLAVRGEVAISYADPRACDLLGSYFPSFRPKLRRLPAEVAHWLRGGRRPSPASAPMALRPLVRERPGARLEIRSLPGPGRPLVVLREKRTHVSPRSLESLGLTPRQAEVLACLAQGKLNAEIAATLAISPNTVARHLEAIFERLGVQTRTAAAAVAFAHIASPGE